jgi:predicted dehydrogenase
MAARKKKVRLGVIGLGMGRAHMMSAMQAGSIEIAAIAEPNPDRVANLYKTAAKRLDAKTAAKIEKLPVFDDYKEMVKSGTVDAVLNALPTPMHADSSLWLLRNGMHVLCEKPPSCTAAEMQRVYNLVRKTGLKYMFVRQQRFDPAKQVARKMVASGKCGDVYHADVAWVRSCSIPWRGGWGVNKDAGGGVLLDLGIHSIDDAWYVMGCPQPVEVFCGMHCAFADLGARKDLSMPYNADDASVGMIRFDNGATISFTVTFALNTDGFPHKELDEEKGRTEWQELKVYGTRAGINVGCRRMILRRKGKEEITTQPLKVESWRGKTGSLGMVENFGRAIQNDVEPENTVEQALMLMRMLEGLRKSAEKGRSMSIKTVVKKQQKAPAAKKRRAAQPSSVSNERVRA